MNGFVDYRRDPVGNLVKVRVEERPKPPPPVRRTILGELDADERDISPEIAAVVARIARAHGVSARAVMGPGRYKQVTAARYEAMTVVRHTLGLSYPEIGRIFDRDHTTVLVGIRKHEAKLAAMYGVAP